MQRFPPDFTRIDNFQCGNSSALSTRVHAAQLQSAWAISLDTHENPTAQCVPQSPSAIENLTISDISIARIIEDQMVLSILTEDPTTFVIVPKELNPPPNDDVTRLLLTQVMKVMVPLKTGKLICLGDKSE